MSSLVYILKDKKYLYKTSFLSSLENRKILSINNLNDFILLVHSKRKTSSVRFFIYINKIQKIFDNKNNDFSFLNNIIFNFNNSKDRKINDILNDNQIKYLKNFFSLLDVFFNINKKNVFFYFNVIGGGISSLLDNILYSFLKLIIFLRKNFINMKDKKLDDNSVNYYTFLVNKDNLENFYKKKKSDYYSLYDDIKILLINKFLKSDVRIKERSKVGKSGARRSEQFSKR